MEKKFPFLQVLTLQVAPLSAGRHGDVTLEADARKQQARGWLLELPDGLLIVAFFSLF